MQQKCNVKQKLMLAALCEEAVFYQATRIAWHRGRGAACARIRPAALGRGNGREIISVAAQVTADSVGQRARAGRMSMSAEIIETRQSIFASTGKPKWRAPCAPSLHAVRREINRQTVANVVKS